MKSRIVELSFIVTFVTTAATAILNTTISFANSQSPQIDPEQRFYETQATLKRQNAKGLLNLAKEVEPTDPARAKDLRASANNIQTQAYIDLQKAKKIALKLAKKQTPKKRQKATN